MYKINKVLVIPQNPFRKEPVDMLILNMVESITPFKPVEYVEYTELPAKNGKRRFQIKAAHGVRDK